MYSCSRGEGNIVKSFSRLSERGQVRRLRRIGAAALSRYNLQAARITFVQRKTNAIFRITTLSRGEFVLRVHPASQATATVIEGELRWLEAIGQETDLRVPVPESAEDGALVVTCEGPEMPEPLHCVLLRWLPGRRRRPQHLSKIELAKVGMVVGELHRHAAHFTLPPGYPRPPWDEVRLLGAEAVLRTAPRLPWLTDRDRRVLAETAANVRAAMAGLKTGPNVWGLIHADLHPWNVLWHQEQTGVIDFDDCGAGFYLFDLAIALENWLNSMADSALRDAFLDGYTRVFALPAGAEDALRTFAAARCYKTITRWAVSTGDLTSPPARVREMIARLHGFVNPNRGTALRG